MLASDLNNPEFSNPTNPDDVLSVQFYVRAVPNNFRTEQEGRPIFEDVNYVKIFTPGNNLNIIDTPVREEHKAKFPRQWAHFMNTKGGDTREVGTPLSQWPLLSASQVEMLRGLKFFTVDAIANSSDQQIMAIGMTGGMDPYAFRDRAKRFLKAAADESMVNHAEEKAKQLEERNAKLEAQMVQMQEQMQALMTNMTKKPGRKPKEKVEA